MTGDILEVLEKDENKYNVDYYFTFNKSYAEEIGKFIKGDYKTIGSFKIIYLISQKIMKKELCATSHGCQIFF